MGLPVSQGTVAPATPFKFRVDDGRWLEGDGPRLAVDLYHPAQGPPRAAVLLVHGNRPAGVREGFYRLLARSMATAA